MPQPKSGVKPRCVSGPQISAATLLLAQGLTLGEIQNVLGLAGIQVTFDLYAHFSREISARAAQHMEQAFAAR